MVKQSTTLLENTNLAIGPVRGLDGILRPGRAMPTLIKEFEDRALRRALTEGTSSVLRGTGPRARSIDIGFTHAGYIYGKMAVEDQHCTLFTSVI